MNTPMRLAVAAGLIAAAAGAQNLYPNPDFDDGQGATGWSADPGIVRVVEHDRSDCPASDTLSASAAEISPLNYALSAHGPCLVFPEAASIDVRLVYWGSAGAFGDAQVLMSVFSNNACLGPQLDGVGAAFEEVGSWTELRGSLDVPAQGSFIVRASSAGDWGGLVQIDEIRVTAPGYLFLDGFDGGGVCRWSSSVG
jgi:hypothetical protein